MEFMGINFQCILQCFGIKDVPLSVHNPQSNAICKQLYQPVGNALHIYLSQDIPFSASNIAELVDSALVTALYAACSTIHHTLGMTPGGIVFNQDMFINIPLLTDFTILQHKQQVVLDGNLCVSTNVVAIMTTNLVTNVWHSILPLPASWILAISVRFASLTHMTMEPLP
jgi:hypothetical protein